MVKNMCFVLRDYKTLSIKPNQNVIIIVEVLKIIFFNKNIKTVEYANEFPIFSKYEQI
jgi:hypothetical protein